MHFFFAWGLILQTTEMNSTDIFNVKVDSKNGQNQILFIAYSSLRRLCTYS